MGYLEKYLNELWYLSAEMAPWLMLGLVFAGLLKVYFPQEKVVRFMGKRNFRSAANAALLGIPMPLCSCGVIPTGIAFFRNGASPGATNSFLISTPQTGVDSIFATYSLLGLPFAIIRPVVAFLTGIFGGVLTNVFGDTQPRQEAAPSTPQTEVFCCDDTSEGCCKKSISGNSGKDRAPGWRVFFHYAFVELLQDIAKWLVIGFLLAALMATVIPDNFFEQYKGLGIIEILVVLAASVPLYICATGSIPVAAVLLAKGISPGAALVFLMAGPATNIATITVIGKTMGKRSLALYLVSIIGGAIISGVLLNLFVPAGWILESMPVGHVGHHHHELLPEWVKIASLAILSMIMLGGYFYSRTRKIKKMEALVDGHVLKVAGMSCSHCEANVKKGLLAVEGIESVEADHKGGVVKISGKNIDLKAVENTITRLGYLFEGTG